MPVSEPRISFKTAHSAQVSRTYRVMEMELAEQGLGLDSLAHPTPPESLLSGWMTLDSPSLRPQLLQKL